MELVTFLLNLELEISTDGEEGQQISIGYSCASNKGLIQKGRRIDRLELITFLLGL